MVDPICEEEQGQELPIVQNNQDDKHSHYYTNSSHEEEIVDVVHIELDPVRKELSDEIRESSNRCSILSIPKERQSMETETLLSKIRNMQLKKFTQSRGTVRTARGEYNHKIMQPESPALKSKINARLEEYRQKYLNRPSETTNSAQKIDSPSKRHNFCTSELKIQRYTNDAGNLHAKSTEKILPMMNKNITSNHFVSNDVQVLSPNISKGLSLQPNKYLTNKHKFLTRKNRYHQFDVEE